MRIHRVFCGELASVFLLALLPPPVWAEEKEANVVAGEVLVLFRSESSVGQAVDLMADQEGEQEVILSSLQDTLEAIEIPLLPQRRTSGGELLLRVDGRQLIDLMIQETQDLPAVEEAVWVPPTTQVRHPRWLDIRVVMRPGPGDSLRELAGCLAENTKLPVQVRETEDGEELLSIDLQQLTHLAVQRLSQLGEVVYAQPNYRLEGFGAGL